MNRTHEDTSTATVRLADLGDAADIFELIRKSPDELIVRPLGDIVRDIDRFTVVCLGTEIVGCASYTIMPEAGDFTKATVELRSVAVRRDLRGHGVGRRLVNDIVKRIEMFKPAQIIVLTYTPAFFRKIGFTEIPKSTIMHKIYTGCVNCMKYGDPFTCPEVAMALTPSDKKTEQ